MLLPLTTPKCVVSFDLGREAFDTEGFGSRLTFAAQDYLMTRAPVRQKQSDRPLILSHLYDDLSASCLK